MKVILRTHIHRCQLDADKIQDVTLYHEIENYAFPIPPHKGYSFNGRQIDQVELNTDKPNTVSISLQEVYGLRTVEEIKKEFPGWKIYGRQGEIV